MTRNNLIGRGLRQLVRQERMELRDHDLVAALPAFVLQAINKIWVTISWWVSIGGAAGGVVSGILSGWSSQMNSFVEPVILRVFNMN